MKTLICASVALAALTADAARAADLGVRGPMAAPAIAPYDWNGPFFGISTGLTVGQTRHSAAAGDLTPTFDMTGGLFGLALGYNWQAGRVLYGIDTDISLSTSRGTSGYLTAPAFQAETRERWFATYRGRVGLVRDSWMFYVTGGGATADVNIIATEAAIANESKVRWGWTAGVGVEAGRIHSFTVKAEYLYADFGNTSYFNPPPLGFFNRAGGVPLHDHVLRLGLNHKFPAM